MRIRSAASLLFVIIIFEVLAFGLIAFQNESFDLTALIIAAIMVFLLVFQYLLLTRFFRKMDRYILIIANLFSAVGVIMLYRLNPETALRQVLFIAVGMAMMVLVMVIVKNWKTLSQHIYWYMGAGLLLLASTMVLGRTSGGATNWINIAGIGFQPSEFVKLILVVVLSGLLSGKASFGRICMAGGFTLLCMGLLMVQRDLGAALLYFGVFVVLLYVATSKIGLTALSLGAGAGAAVASYHLFPHVQIRVAVWQNPWLTYETQGYQIVQGLMAIASGGFFGMGLGLGSPKAIPAYQTDYIFAVICEEFGIIFGLVLVAFYLIFIVRGALIAMACREKFYALLAFGCTALITLQSFIIIAGIIKLIPLTGITLPFISAGGTSMLTCFMLVGILEGISIMNGEDDERELQQEVHA
ncbi:MAG: FtsW/RodA/SpoVE family cell cycle protein [Christensenellales bacterium]